MKSISFTRGYPLIALALACIATLTTGCEYDSIDAGPPRMVPIYTSWDASWRPTAGTELKDFCDGKTVGFALQLSLVSTGTMIGSSAYQESKSYQTLSYDPSMPSGSTNGDFGCGRLRDVYARAANGTAITLSRTGDCQFEMRGPLQGTIRISGAIDIDGYDPMPTGTPLKGSASLNTLSFNCP